MEISPAYQQFLSSKVFHYSCIHYSYAIANTIFKHFIKQPGYTIHSQKDISKPLTFLYYMGSPSQVLYLGCLN